MWNRKVLKGLVILFLVFQVQAGYSQPGFDDNTDDETTEMPIGSQVLQMVLVIAGASLGYRFLFKKEMEGKS